VIAIDDNPDRLRLAAEEGKLKNWSHETGISQEGDTDLLRI